MIRSSQKGLEYLNTVGVRVIRKRESHQIVALGIAAANIESETIIESGRDGDAKIQGNSKQTNANPAANRPNPKQVLAGTL